MKKKPLRISLQYFAESSLAEQSEQQGQSTPPTTEQALPNDTTAPDAAQLLAQLQERTIAYETVRQELEALRQEHLSQEERTRLELAQRETEIANREATLLDRENRLHAIQALEQSRLTGGGITTADLMPFVMDSTTAGIDSKVRALAALLDKRAQAQTDSIYQGASRQPQQIRGDTGGGNAVPIIGAATIAAQARAKEIREKYTGGKK